MAGGKHVLALRRFRFYMNNTGGEATSTPLADINGNIVVVNLADRQVHLRLLLEETGGSGGSGDLYLEWRIGAGSGSRIGAASLRIQNDPTSDLVDGAVTTNRPWVEGGNEDGIWDPFGVSWWAGRQEEGDGEIPNFFHPSGRFTEHVFALDIIADDNEDADVLELKLTESPGVVVMDVSPFITISKPPTPRTKATGERVGPHARSGTGVKASAAASAVRAPRATASRIGPRATGEAVDKDRGEVS